jgi:hypothetical protein
VFVDLDYSYLLAATSYYNSSPYLTLDNFPLNDTIAGLAGGLAEAHKAYNVAGQAIFIVHFLLIELNSPGLRSFSLSNQVNGMFSTKELWNMNCWSGAPLSSLSHLFD